MMYLTQGSGVGYSPRLRYKALSAKGIKSYATALGKFLVIFR